MERHLMRKLIAWKGSANRKPLILWGARQVGKTWLMKEFGSTCFEDAVYISFYHNKRIAEVFLRDYDTGRILRALEVELHVKIKPEQTLLIFDEVQSVPQVVESLKYFCEEAREYAVIAAGSLLGVALHEGVSFPVGKVDELHLYPMNFREFLEACGEEQLAKWCADYRQPETTDFAERYLELLRTYYCVGGMPEAVLRYTQTFDMREVREVQLAILHQYEGDFGKHIQVHELPRIRMVWNALPMQLAKDNRKFFFGQIKHGARHKDFESAIQWLADCGLIYKVSKVEKPAMPLKSYVDFSSFKLYLIDVGLLGALSELDINSVIGGSRIFTEFKGALTEQYVLQQIISDTAYTPYYYASEKSAYEVDFLIQKGKDIVPIEVKAEDNLKAKSLRFYCEKFQPALAVRTSAAGFREQDWMVNVPLWAVMSI